MSPHLTPGQGRVLALALLLVFGALVYGLAVHPIVSRYVEYQLRIDTKREQLRRYRQVVARGQWAGAALKRLQSDGLQRNYYLPGGTLALASAKLQEHVKRLARSSNGELISTQVLSARDSGDTPTVTLRVQMKGSLETLLNLFYAIETGTPVVILKNVVITSHGMRRVAGNEAGQYLDELDIRFDLVGYAYEERGDG